MHKVNFWTTISRSRETEIELFTWNMDPKVYTKILKDNLKEMIKTGGKEIKLVWDNSCFRINSKAKEFYDNNKAKELKVLQNYQI